MRKTDAISHDVGRVCQFIFYAIIDKNRMGFVMTAKMENTFIDYADFIDVAMEAFETAPKKLFQKIMRKVIDSFHVQAVELNKQAIEIDEMHTLPVDDLDEFYDTVLETVENFKLLKKQLLPLLEKDELFTELNEEAHKVHDALIHYMDRMGQLEVRILQESHQSA